MDPNRLGVEAAPQPGAMDGSGLSDDEVLTMKNLAALLMALSVGAFSIGCGEGDDPAVDGNGVAPATNGDPGYTPPAVEDPAADPAAGDLEPPPTPDSAADPADPNAPAVPE